MDKEQEFRDRMLEFAASTKAILENMREDQLQHVAHDLERFKLERRARRKLARQVAQLGGQVTQTVTTNKYNWGVVAAWVSAFVAAASVGWALIEKFGGALKP
jgi:hypothetical protein